MADKPYPFIWYDVVTTDPDGAATFYEKVAGLTYSKGDPNAPVDYRHATAPDGAGIGGCAALSTDALNMGARPAWVGYVYVPDVDAAIIAMEADGAKLMMPAFDVPGAGRIALIADPWGAPLHIMAPTGEGESTAFRSDPTPGHIGWNELPTDDPDGAMAFYAKHFGWSYPDAMDMGPMGKYHFLSFTGGSADCPQDNSANGAILRKSDEMPVSIWVYYIWTDDIDTAIARTQEAGGNVLMGPHEVPGAFGFFRQSTRKAPFSLWWAIAKDDA